jgi:hypothetical protein
MEHLSTCGLNVLAPMTFTGIDSTLPSDFITKFDQFVKFLNLNDEGSKALFPSFLSGSAASWHSITKNDPKTEYDKLTWNDLKLLFLKAFKTLVSREYIESELQKSRQLIPNNWQPSVYRSLELIDLLDPDHNLPEDIRVHMVVKNLLPQVRKTVALFGPTTLQGLFQTLDRITASENSVYDSLETLASGNTVSLLSKILELQQQSSASPTTQIPTRSLKHGFQDSRPIDAKLDALINAFNDLKTTVNTSQTQHFPTGARYSYNQDCYYSHDPNASLSTWTAPTNPCFCKENSWSHMPPPEWHQPQGPLNDHANQEPHYNDSYYPGMQSQFQGQYQDYHQNPKYVHQSQYREFHRRRASPRRCFVCGDVGHLANAHRNDYQNTAVDGDQNYYPKNV